MKNLFRLFTWKEEEVEGKWKSLVGNDAPELGSWFRLRINNNNRASSKYFIAKYYYLDGYCVDIYLDEHGNGFNLDDDHHCTWKPIQISQGRDDDVDTGNGKIKI